MATWDFGGGCPCGVSKECDCGMVTDRIDMGYALHPVPRPQTKDGKIKSDGGSTDYYKIPAGATDLIDLIEHKKMPFSLGNIFKACYRLGEKKGVDAIYDLNKIIFFAERLKKQFSEQ